MQFSFNFKLPKFLRSWNEAAFQPREDDQLYADIIINPATGEAQVDVKNGDGTNCKALTADIEAAMGGADTKELKPEFRRSNRGDRQGTVRTTGRNTLTN